jgi:hypothetical protein
LGRWKAAIAVEIRASKHPEDDTIRCKRLNLSSVFLGVKISSWHHEFTIVSCQSAVPDISLRRVDPTKLVVKEKVELVHANPSHEDLGIPSALDGSASEKNTAGVLKPMAKSKAAKTRARAVIMGKKPFADKAASLLNQISHITHIPNKLIKAMMSRASRRNWTLLVAIIFAKWKSCFVCEMKKDLLYLAFGFARREELTVADFSGRLK